MPQEFMSWIITCRENSDSTEAERNAIPKSFMQQTGSSWEDTSDDPDQRLASDVSCFLHQRWLDHYPACYPRRRRLRFRIHKLLFFTSLIFKDMFKLSQPLSATSNIDAIDVVDPTRASKDILCFIYPSTDPPAINDLTLLADFLVLVDKYDTGVARPRLRRSLLEFAGTEPPRVCAIPY
ncbi:hypothetical protein BDM02DRAFT_1282383 [Thelephora ganbajun]|uniref:Uncharacterized protein n=1 Tax=Thelephora ganbajun TaxID=370292 RepID=A0ACB6Z3D2_THEGA|nr:hypothetical protein BDM02DRAFT_1282383 [Thelephora ganbajun]